MAAREYAQAWVKHPPGITEQEFLDQLRPYAMPEHLISLRGIDPARIPATKVVGMPSPTRSTTGTVVEVDQMTNARTLHITVLKTPSGWQVYEVKPQ